MTEATPDPQVVEGEVLDSTDTPAEKRSWRPSKATLVRFGLGAASAAAVFTVLRRKDKDDNSVSAEVDLENLPDPLGTDPTV